MVSILRRGVSESSDFVFVVKIGGRSGWMCLGFLILGEDVFRWVVVSCKISEQWIFPVVSWRNLSDIDLLLYLLSFCS